ncbi:unnamed protein product [Symbiodinium pilosum]|uniref:PDZ domain-containing protein n=1 Tax=Symbiodinium pilosum TaxID=2952 RepID=A0A812QSG0_SYMPI|nr:unnamed protein product [Symbiodinium pilosum]
MVLTWKPWSVGEIVCVEDHGPELFPLLKVSPPIPVGRLAGRFKVQIWRASPEHKLNLIVGPGSQSDVVVMLDASHLGIYSGDEVLSVNDISVQNFRHFADILDSCGHDLEIQFYHKEDFLEMCCGPAICVPQTMPVQEAQRFGPKCRAESWTQREVLSASTATSLERAIFRLQMQRTSMKQPFGLPLGVVSMPAEPSEPSNVASEDILLTAPKCHRLCVTESFWSDRDVSDDVDGTHCAEEEEEVSQDHPASLRGPVVVLQAVPLLGLYAGDELLRINGEDISDLCACKAAMKSAINLSLEFRRPDFVPRNFSGAEVESPALRLKTSRRSDDWHSASSTKDCSREAAEESWFQSLLLKMSCNDVARQAAENAVLEVHRSFDAKDLRDAVTI